jgi:4-hydroxybenzoate polyprenyltransferase
LKPAEWLRLARPRQWTKNLLLFAALLFSGRFREPAPILLAAAGFVAFTLFSASVYAFNDLRDAAEDRLHAQKRHRPVASGKVKPGEAVFLAALWAGAGIGLSAWLGGRFLALGVAYLALSTLYSQWTKHQVILDVLSLAAGFVLRAVAGAVAVDVRISEWLLVCTTLLALFLGLAKRRAEVAQTGSGRSRRRILEHYSLPLLDQMIAVVASATVVAYMLYAFSSHTLERGPWMMLTVPFVLYGIFRYLYLAHQKGQGAAPEQVLLGDRALQVDVALWVLTSAAILYFNAKSWPPRRDRRHRGGPGRRGPIRPSQPLSSEATLGKTTLAPRRSARP